MYETLVEALRLCAKYNNAMDALMNAEQAADAIEELSREVDIDNAAMTAMYAAMPRWIPVAERLPEKRKWVLCRCEANITEVLRYENNEWYHDPRHVYYFDFVTHWMPLPERPEEESK